MCPHSTQTFPRILNSHSSLQLCYIPTRIPYLQPITIQNIVYLFHQKLTYGLLFSILLNLKSSYSLILSLEVDYGYPSSRKNKPISKGLVKRNCQNSLISEKTRISEGLAKKICQ